MVERSVQSAFESAEEIYADDTCSGSVGNRHKNSRATETSDSGVDSGLAAEAGRAGYTVAHQHSKRPRNHTASDPRHCPIIPLGHRNGCYFFISASGELRSLKAEALEAGRGVLALFEGVSGEAETWCRVNFPTSNNDWSHKAAGRWIIKNCNSAGVFDPSTADIRSIGVWRDQDKKAVAHCGNLIMYSNGEVLPLSEYKAKHIMIGAAPITRPANNPVHRTVMSEVLRNLRNSWGWRRKFDADIFFGWIAAACLGGFPIWRAHLYVYGSRGSGKSKLMELASSLLGDLGGEVVNDATEAGLRQSRNNQARPVFIDEFEPDENARNAAKLDNMLALFRRMSGGAGGRISRGGADHTSVSFRTLGAVYVTSINHIHLEPQDRSRFVMLELGALPDAENPYQAAALLQELEEQGREFSSAIFRRMLAQSERWDATHATISSEARRLGADPRQADTVATILSGRDLALFDDEISASRVRELKFILLELLDDASEADVTSEGAEALDYLVSAVLPLDHGIRRSVGELLKSVITDVLLSGVDDANAALDRFGVHVLKNRESVAVRLGKASPVAKLYSDTKWRSGAHGSALLKVDGAEKRITRAAPYTLLGWEGPKPIPATRELLAILWFDFLRVVATRMRERLGRPREVQQPGGARN